MADASEMMAHAVRTDIRPRSSRAANRHPPHLPSNHIPTRPCIPEPGTVADLYDLMTDVYVKSFTHLKDRHRADDALKLLQRIASLVKPIMRKRGWVLPTLAEFFPNNQNLLGESASGLLCRRLWVR